MEQTLSNDDIKLLKRNIKSLINEYVIPAEKKEGPGVEELPLGVINDLQEKAKKMGLWCLNAKQEWGGAGLSIDVQMTLNEEIVQHRLGFYNPGGGAFGSDIPRFLDHCSNEQIEKYVSLSVQSGNGCYLAIREKNEGNDLTNLTCTAEKKGNKWSINGEKSYVTNVESSDFGIILVNCEQHGETKPTLFILDKNDVIEKKQRKLIDVRDSEELIFNDLELDNSRIIGEIGEGTQYIEKWLQESQLILAARSMGIAIKALEYAKDYALIRVTRGKTLSEFSSIRTMLAKSTVEIESTRLLIKEAAKKLIANSKDSKQFVQMAKMSATEIAFKVVDRALQIHGGAGFTRDFPLERWYKELRIARLELTSTETLYDQIADYVIEQVK